MDVCLKQDVKQLFKEVEQVRDEAVEAWLISEQSNRTDVNETLMRLSENLTELQSKSQEYRKYQREFKVIL